MKDHPQTPHKTGRSVRSQSQALNLNSDQAKIAVSMTLLAIVVIVTLADSSLMTRVSPDSNIMVTSQSSFSSGGSRTIASVADKTMEPNLASENQAFVHGLALRDLSPHASIGHNPTTVEELAFGLLEGKYSIKLRQGKIAAIEFSEASVDQAVKIDNLDQFIESHRELLPDFKEGVHTSSSRENEGQVHVYQLLNAGHAAVANVQFHVDDSNRLLALRVSPVQVAVK